MTATVATAGVRLLRHAAVHEAGHSVVACLFKLADPRRYPLIGEVFITADGRAGLTRFVWCVSRKTIAALGMVACAGFSAEIQRFGCANAGYVKDRERFHGWLTTAGYSAVERIPLIDRVTRETAALLAQQPVRAATAALAAALIERRRLSGDEVLGIVQERISHERVAF